MNLNAVRIIIPTYNRPAYLARILKYYQYSDPQIPITVADSSADDSYERNRKVIALYPKLSVAHDRYPSEINPHYKFGKARDRTQEPYSIMCADDDFVPAASIAVGFRFLESHPDFTLVHGKYLVFHKTARGTLRWHPIYRHKTLDAGNPLERMKAHMTNYYPTLFGLWKTSDARSAYAALTENRVDPMLWGELLPSFLMPLFGKAKVLNNILWCLRDGSATEKNSWPTLEQYQEDGRFDSAYNQMERAASPLLENATSMSAETAVPFFRTAIQAYITNLRRPKNRAYLAMLADRICTRALKEITQYRFAHDLEKVQKLVIQ